MIINGFGGRGTIGAQTQASWLTIANISINSTFTGGTWYSSHDSWSPASTNFPTFVWPDVTIFRCIRLRIVSNSLKCTAAVSFNSSISSFSQHFAFTTPKASKATDWQTGMYTYSASYNGTNVTVAANADVFSNTSLKQTRSGPNAVIPNYSSDYQYLGQYDCKLERDSSFYFTMGSSYCLSCTFTSDFRYLYSDKTLTWVCNAIFEGLPY